MQNKSPKERIEHTIAPVFNKDCKILILGTMPSPKSREVGFYYSHPQNRFWAIMANLFEASLPKTKEEKIEFLLSHQIALWDVLQSCDIQGADDGSIQNPTPNHLETVLEKAPIQQIYTTGQKAFSLYKKLCLPTTNRQAIALPSTSPANCRYYNFEALRDAYKVILPYLSH